jgi:TPP-dependent pyruvate/acetoin dehydrogenase alpha subunit
MRVYVVVTPRYRSLSEIRQWQEADDPLARFRRYMEARDYWSQEQETRARDQERLAVLRVRLVVFNVVWCVDRHGC